jgi:nicotinamidase-related amidase
MTDAPASIALKPARTALVLIDLQRGIVAMPLAPRSGDEVVTAARALAGRFRAAGAQVVLVHVGWSKDGGDRPSANVDQPQPGTLPEGFSDFVEGLGKADDDLVVLKRQWGAFTGTDLDLQLRRRGIDTIVLAGIATNFGVESTARSAWEHGYDVIVAEDVCTSRAAELHDFAIRHILPRIARVRAAAQIDFESQA